jgi:hypothetical protein
MKTRLLLIPALMTLLLISVAFTSNQVDALSCGIGPFGESFGRHDLLLHGILTEKYIDRMGVLFGSSDRGKLSTLVFETVTVYKGVHQDQFIIHADLSWDDWYVVGAEYVLFADKKDDHYLRELCVGQYIAFPQIIQFLDSYPLNITSGIGIHHLYDLVTGDDRIRLDNLMSLYTDINRGNTGVIMMKSVGNDKKYSCDFQDDIKQAEKYLINDNHLASNILENSPEYTVSSEITLDTNPQTAIITFEGDKLKAKVSVLNGKEFDSCFYVYNSKLINKTTGEIERNHDLLSRICYGDKAHEIIPDLCPSKRTSTIPTEDYQGGGYINPECQKGHELVNGICQSVNYNYVGSVVDLESKLSHSYTSDHINRWIYQVILPFVAVFTCITASFLITYFILKRKNIPSRPYMAVILAGVLLFFGIPNLVSSMDSFLVFLSDPVENKSWIFNFQFIPRLISISMVSVAVVLLFKFSIIRKLIKR